MPGLAFEETMTGGFALGETDPERGQEIGEARNPPLALHASVQIDDVDRFAEHPDHPGDLRGSIEFPPLGDELKARDGVFKLFSPGPTADEKRMVYELAVDHAGEPCYLAGQKKIHDDPGFDLWSDTTTLYTRLHEGTDTSGPVVGAGILSLGADDLVDLVSTMRVPDAHAAEAKAEALTTFGTLFLGELWDTYAEHASAETANGS